MKVYISADIEGVCGATAWDEARKEQPTYREYQRQMTAEVAAACEGASRAGATEVVVKDAHGDGRNLVGSALPSPTKLVRGYSGHPFAMVQELDETFDAALFVGYHARAGSGGNPLAHTLSSRKLHEVRLNGRPASEYLLHCYAAALVRVPVVLVTGDQDLCDEVACVCPAATTVAVKQGHGATTINLHPSEAVARIRAGAKAALTADPSRARVTIPKRSRLEVVFKDQALAYAKSFYPGVELVDAHTVALETDDYFEVLRALVFLVPG